MNDDESEFCYSSVGSWMKWRENKEQQNEGRGLWTSD